jgi:hypothetical protein
MGHLLHRPLNRPTLLVALFALIWSSGLAEANRPDAAVGEYHISIFMPESDGSNDEDLEDWEGWMETEVVDQVLGACLFWAETAPDSANFSCHVSYYATADTPTAYEPITRPGGRPLFGFWGGDEDLWINEMMDLVGYSSIWLYYFDEVEDYNDAQIESHDTDEAFSAFIVNSREDEDGRFSDGSSAYVPELRAPYMVMTWDNNGWRPLLGAEALRLVGAHEMGHLFGAEDEYSGSNSSCTDVSAGYANRNHEDCPGGAVTSCLMRQNAPCGYLHPYPICYWTRGQIGWAPECEPAGICGLRGPEPCASRDQCVDGAFFCDGEADCDDASDELGCRPCASDEYRCAEGDCQPSWELCLCPDSDGDGYRDQRCGGDDCDDSRDQVFPGASEICNGLDDDCDGVVDEGFDRDRDGHTTCASPPDCNDFDESIYPGAEEICGDGIDQSCSGEDLLCDCPDLDGDGHADPRCGGDDCDDNDPTVGGSWPHCDGEDDAGPEPDGDVAGEEVDGGCSCELAGRPASVSALRRLIL